MANFFQKVHTYLTIGGLSTTLAYIQRQTGVLIIGPLFILKNDHPNLLFPALSSRAISKTLGYLKHHIKVLIWACFISLTSYAQPSDNNYFFSGVLEEEGTRLNPVNKIIQDKYGIMWFGTAFQGIARFDGFQKKLYRWDPTDSTSLRGEEIKALYKDLAGNIWTSPWRAGFYRYDPASDQFKILPIENRTKRVPDISALAQTKDSTLWAALPYHGLYKFNPTTETLELFDESISTSTLIDLPNGTVVGGYPNGIVYIESEKVYSKIFINLSGSSPSAIGQDAEGHLWIGTNMGQLLVYDLKNRKVIRRLDSQIGVGTRIAQIHLDRKKDLWVLTNHGIFIFKRDGQVVTLKSNPNQPGAIGNNATKTIFEDPNGLIWVGHDQGISLYDPHLMKFSIVTFNANNQFNPYGQYITSISNYENKLLLFGTEDGYLFQKEMKTGELHRTLIQSKKGLGGAVISVTPAGRNQVFLGTTKGLFLYNLSTHGVKRQGYRIQLMSEKTRQIVNLTDQTRLYGTESGLVIEDIPSGNQQLYQPDTSGYSMTNSVTRLFADEKGYIWVGTYKGLHLFDLQSRSFLPVEFPDGKEKELFTDVPILNLVEHEGNLWVATMNRGLFQIHLADFHNDAKFDAPFSQWTATEGLSDNVVYGIIPDSKNSLWISTNHGVSRFFWNAPTPFFLNYDTHDGLTQNEFNMYANAQFSNGEIYLGGVNGLNSFFPSQVDNINSNAPKVYLRDATILNTLSSSGGKLETIDLRDITEIELSHEKNFIRLAFYSDSYSNHVPATFEYKLEGIDDSWVPTGRNAEAIYTDLNPGTYLFKVKAYNYDQVAGSTTELVIKIGYPFWMKWWFILLCVAFFITIPLLIVAIRSRKEAERRMALQAEILETTREIQLQKELIEAQNEELKVSQENLTRINNSKDFIFSILSHDLRSPLTTLKGFLGLMSESAEVFSKDEIKGLSNKIRQSVGTSLDLIDNILFWSQSQNGSISFKPQLLNLRQLINKTIDVYHLSAEKKGVSLKGKVEGDLFIEADENMMSFIFRNLISNALKFTPTGGQITIKGTPKDRKLELRFEDSGIGIPKDHLDLIFNPNQTFTTRGTANEKGTGLGLKLVQEFVKQHKGTLNIESTPGKGTCFIIMLTLSKHEQTVSDHT